jgi:2,3-bisphosphoglycerate-independent phosphoglycerate mutase
VVAVLVILDGASEPLGAAPTSLERARTPTLDGLARGGALSRLRTVAPGLPVGSETAIPTLLGWAPPGPVDRGALEAAAHEVRLAPGERAWRVDVLDAAGRRAAEADARRAAEALAALAPRHAVHAIGGHRLLLAGPPPLPSAARRPGLAPWPEGVLPPSILGPETVVVAARGAAAGIARRMGARVVVPPGATGRPDSDLGAKAASAIEALRTGAARIVVHVGGPDEAAHARDPTAKVAALERADGDLIAPLAAALRDVGGTLRVCPDHGCDPRTGAHDGSPVPCVDWPAARAPRTGAHDGSPVPCVDWPAARAPGGASGGRLGERAVAALPVRDLAAAGARSEAA